MFILYKKMGG